MLHPLPVIWFLCAIQVSTGLYFHLNDETPLCFIEDVPDDTRVQGDYILLRPLGNSYNVSFDLSIHVHVTDPDEKTLHSRAYTGSGRFLFNSHKGGEYRICVSSNPSSWLGSNHLRVHLDLWTADHTINYGEVASHDRLNDLQLRVRQLSDQLESISKDQNYQRVREEYFRQLSESTSQRVTFWSIAQLLLLAAVGFWQMRHLRAFFQAKKLV
ncbi:unnamed protein product [Dicrocoelium dendriticum]|nr:unnamed protein product [Dicrocoelium dendriticum]